MMRSPWILPALALLTAGCTGSGGGGATARYSPDDAIPGRSPMSYGGAPTRTGSSTSGARAATPAPMAATPTPRYVAPAPAPSYATPPPTAYAPPPPPPPAAAYPAPAARAPVAPAPAPSHANLPTAPSAFTWARSLAEAQTTARSQGKLIFLETGRDACGNCQKIRQKVIPEVGSELGAMCVGYYDDCDRDAGSQSFQILTRNLPGAVMLPLVGWVTPDLRWVHGFSGGRDAGRFRQEMQTARATYRQMASAPQPMGASPLGSLPAPPRVPDAEVAALAAPYAPTTEPVAAATAAMASEAPAFATPAVAEATTADRTTWAREELARAATALEASDVATARAILAEVRVRSEGLPEAREADKGEVAIWNLRRLEATTSTEEANQVRAQARAELRGTVWARLFA